MTYFQYTAQDLGVQRAAGIEETRRDIGEKLLALVDDSVQKLNSEDELDQGYIMEDLLARLVEIAQRGGADVTLFADTAGQYANHTYAYPITLPGTGLPLADAIRETWEAQKFNGIPRHEHAGMPDDKCYRSFGAQRCNAYFGAAVHETEFEERTK
jgi:hypothetical protein